MHGGAHVHRQESAVQAALAGLDIAKVQAASAARATADAAELAEHMETDAEEVAAKQVHFLPSLCPA